MYLAGFIERMGTGTGDIISLCEEAGLKKAPEFIQEEIFKTILWRKNFSAPETQNADVTEDVTEDRLNTIVELISKNNKITTSEIANIMGVVRRTIARDIEKLKRDSIVVRTGSDKHGFWEIINPKTTKK